VNAVGCIMGKMPYKCGPYANNFGCTEQEAHANWLVTIVFYLWCVVF
jgi:hypothetical protein